MLARSADRTARPAPDGPPDPARLAPPGQDCTRPTPARPTRGPPASVRSAPARRMVATMPSAIPRDPALQGGSHAAAHFAPADARRPGAHGAAPRAGTDHDPARRLPPPRRLGAPRDGDPLARRRPRPPGLHGLRASRLADGARLGALRAAARARLARPRARARRGRGDLPARRLQPRGPRLPARAAARDRAHGRAVRRLPRLLALRRARPDGLRPLPRVDRTRRPGAGLTAARSAARAAAARGLDPGLDRARLRALARAAGLLAPAHPPRRGDRADHRARSPLRALRGAGRPSGRSPRGRVRRPRLAAGPRRGHRHLGGRHPLRAGLHPAHLRRRAG